MKTLLQVFLFCLSGQVLFAQQIEKRVIGQYYYLDHPTSDIFSMAFAQPDGIADPKLAPNGSHITDDDIIISASSKSQTLTVDKSRSASFLFNTWNRSRGLIVSGQFANVRHVTLKDDSWAKIKDNNYHVIEALKADTVLFNIKHIKGDSVDSKAIEKIVGLFVNTESTVVGKILNTFNSDSSNANTSSVVKLKYHSDDSVSLYIIDTTVYYAVRYVSIGEAEENEHKILGIINGKLPAPDCAPEFATKNNSRAPETVTKNMAGKTTQPLFTDCDPGEQNIITKFIYDEAKNISCVMIVRRPDNQNVSPDDQLNSNKQVLDTVYISEYIDFNNDYADEEFSGQRSFVVSEDPTTSQIQNNLMVCRFAFRFDPKTKMLTITNFKNGQFRTYVTHETVAINYFPH